MEIDNKITAKMSGYLEKKGKMKMMSSYKKYWFVLEGRLLLYYRSKDEYETLSSFKGSITLGPTCCIKPCSSTVGLFQIETRSTTVTLRAENMEEQNKWMQAIMSALNQNSSPTKLGHFRYSLDESPTEKDTEKLQLERQNSFPQALPQQENNKTIIEKLQKMGAQSYGGHIGQISKMANSKWENHKQKTMSDECISTSSASVDSSREISTFRDSVLIENEEYGTYENRNSQRLVENEQYAVIEKTLSSSEESETNADGSNIYEQISSSESISRVKTCPREKPMPEHHYCSIDNIDNVDTKENSNIIYNEPKYSEIVDLNENNVMVENAEYVSSQSSQHQEDNAYSVTTICNAQRRSFNGTEHQHADLIKICNEYDEPKVLSCSSSSGSANEGKHNSKNKRKKLKINREKVKKAEKKSKKDQSKVEEKQEVKVKKSSSFMERFYKRKSKSKENSKSSAEDSTKDEEIYECVPDDIVDKIDLAPESQLQMLSELHNVLENKKTSVIKKLLTELENTEEKLERSNEKPSDDEVFICEDKESISPRAKEKLCPLVPPKPQKPNARSPYHDVPKNNQPIVQIPPKRKIGKNKNLDNITINDILDDLEQQKPFKPPMRTDRHSQTPDRETRMDRHLHTPDKETRMDRHLHTPDKETRMDRYLQTPDKESRRGIHLQTPDGRETRMAAQSQTPERENNEHLFGGEVELRNKRRPADSDELNRLLDELVKVTTAPIMTPGVTTSLINPNLSDDELLKLVPIRRRRHSEPDYDVPRPHRSLINLPKRQEDELIATRFFGPILKPSDMNVQKMKRSHTAPECPPSLPMRSISPDSLEPDLYYSQRTTTDVRAEDECNVSNDLTQNPQNIIKRSTRQARLIKSRKFPHVCEGFEGKEIYSEPNSKQVLTVASHYTCQSKLYMINSTKNIQMSYSNSSGDESNENVFVDSLEIDNIGSTAF